MPLNSGAIEMKHFAVWQMSMANDGPDKSDLGKESPLEGENENSSVVYQVGREVYFGGTPHVDHVERWAKIHPDAPERFLAQAEAESKHRREMERAKADLERQLIPGNLDQMRRAQWMAFVPGFSGVSGAVILGAVGQPWPASIMGGATLFMIIVAFLKSGVVGNDPEPHESYPERRSQDQDV